MRDWLVLLAVGAGTYLLRAAFLISHRTETPAGFRRALPHIGPAVVGAMVVPALILPGGVISAQAAVPGLVGAAFCWLVWWRSHSTPLALVVGLLTAWAAAAALST